MTLQEAIASRRHLRIIHPIGGIRPIADLFLLADGSGIVFADLGWNEPDNPTHPFHVVEGVITGAGPWDVGDSLVEEVQEQDDMVLDFMRWWDAIRDQDPAELRRNCASSIEGEFSVSLAE